MGKKKEKEKKEKPLAKMTAKELRELALTLEGIVGVHAMNKNELIAAVKEAKGIVEGKMAGALSPGRVSDPSRGRDQFRGVLFFAEIRLTNRNVVCP